MKRTVTLLLLLAMPLISSTAVEHQQSTDFKPFWERFKTAVTTGDKNTVASLSKFPIGMSYGVRSLKTKAELIRRYKEVAYVYAGLSDRDRTFEWLEKDFQQRSGLLPELTWQSVFDDLRSDPRYADLVRRMGLEP